MNRGKVVAEAGETEQIVYANIGMLGIFSKAFQRYTAKVKGHH